MICCGGYTLDLREDRWIPIRKFFNTNAQVALINCYGQTEAVRCVIGISWCLEVKACNIFNFFYDYSLPLLYPSQILSFEEEELWRISRVLFHSSSVEACEGRSCSAVKRVQPMRAQLLSPAIEYLSLSLSFFHWKKERALENKLPSLSLLLGRSLWRQVTACGPAQAMKRGQPMSAPEKWST